jgi:hypothetical protein
MLFATFCSTALLPACSPAALERNNIVLGRQEAESARAAIEANTLGPYTIEFAEDVLRGDLRDPESARFRDVRRNTEKGAVCGYVNANNGYGGYVGEAPFIVYYSAIFHHLQIADGAEVAKILTIPFIDAFCPDDDTTVSTDPPAAQRGRGHVGP